MKNYPKTITEAIDRLLHIHHEEDLISLDLANGYNKYFRVWFIRKIKIVQP